MATFLPVRTNPHTSGVNRTWGSPVEALLKEDKPFGEYWAIRTLRRQVETDPTVLDRNTRRRLEAHLKDLPPGTDRANELREVLRAAT
jgi:hypothetical protein